MCRSYAAYYSWPWQPMAKAIGYRVSPRCGLRQEKLDRPKRGLGVELSLSNHRNGTMNSYLS